MTKTDNTLSDSNDLSASDLFVQNWEHVRHVENERLGFTSVYFVIVAAIVAFLSQAKASPAFTVALLLLLLVFSVIGALMSVRLKADMEAHGARLDLIASNSRFPEYFTFGAEEGWTTKVKLRSLFPLMYTLLAIVFLVSATAITVRPSLIQEVVQPVQQPAPLPDCPIPEANQ